MANYILSSVDSFDYTGGGIWCLTGKAVSNGKIFYWCGDIYEGSSFNEINFFTAYPFDLEAEESGECSFMPLPEFDSLLCDCYDTQTGDWYEFCQSILRYVIDHSNEDALSCAYLYRDQFADLLCRNTSGKWCAHVIHTDHADYPSYAYRGSIFYSSGMQIEAEGVDWSSFCADVQSKTGIRFPKRSAMRFFKISDNEQIAGLDAANVRGMMQVTKKELFVNGWRAYDAVNGICKSFV